MLSYCVVFTTDQRYLFPTLVSAATARQNLSRNLGDVIVFCFDASRDVAEKFRRAYSAAEVALVCLPSNTIEGESAMMARLFLERYVPDPYENILYMDSDILVTGSLDPLMRANVSPGCFFAANDPSSFIADEEDRSGRSFRAYLRSVGIPPGDARFYFNSGVLRINRRGWDEFGQDAWRFYSRKRPLLRFPDQDAMNATARDRRLSLSLRWNYPIFLNNARVRRFIEPRVFHFMSQPKPWHGGFTPWGNDAAAPYRHLIRQFPELAHFNTPLQVTIQAKYALQQRWKQLAETITWGFTGRRARILEYEQRCDLSSIDATLEPSIA